MKQPNETELAYFAGYFDGEGCIHISRKGSRVVGIKSCYPKVVKRFHRVFGGRCDKGSKKNNKIQWRHWFHFRICGEDAVAVIKSIYPFMREKKEQARLFIKHSTTKDAYTKAQYAMQIKSLKKVRY